MTETLAYGYSYESTQWELSNEYQYDRVKMVFSKIFAFLCLDESSLIIGRVNSQVFVISIIDGDSIFWRNSKLLRSWWLIWPIQNEPKNLKNYWNPCIWVLIWEHSVRAIQWILTWLSLDSFQVFYILVLWKKVASVLEGVSMPGFRLLFVGSHYVGSAYLLYPRQGQMWLSQLISKGQFHHV